MLRGSVPATDMSYVCAEIAFVLARMAGWFISREEEFVSLINGIDCSIALRAELMRDLLPRWNEISRLQGRFSKEACEAAVLECVRHADLDNVNVPTSIIPLITKVLSAEPGGVMADIACGHGIVLAQALSEDSELRGEAVDVSTRSVAFAEMVLAPFKMRAGAYLRSAFDFVGDHVGKYDKVFCYPPFGMRMDRNFRWEELQRMLPGAFADVRAGCRSELMFALATVAAMKESGRAVVLLPQGALFNQMGSAVAARKFLLESGYLDCVITLPERMLERTQIGVSLLVFSRKENRRCVTMVDAGDLGVKGRRFNTLSSEAVERIVNAAYGFRNDAAWNERHRKEISCDEIRLNGYDFNARRYFEKAILPQFEDAVRFGDLLVSVERGAAIGSKEMDDLVSSGEGVCYYLSPSHIDNGLVASGLPEMKEVPRKVPAVEAGDLILMRTGANSKVVVFDGPLDKPVVLSANLFVCRLDRKRVDAWYLKAFLESDEGRSVLSSIAIGAVIKSISIKSLEEMRVPLPPMEKQLAIAKDFKSKFDRMRELKRELERVCREMTEVFK